MDEREQASKVFFFFLSSRLGCIEEEMKNELSFLCLLPFKISLSLFYYFF